MKDSVVVESYYTDLHRRAVQAHRAWKDADTDGLQNYDAVLARRVPCDQSLLSRVLQAEGPQSPYYPSPHRKRCVEVANRVIDICRLKAGPVLEPERIITDTGITTMRGRVIDWTCLNQSAFGLHRLLVQQWVQAKEPPFFGELFSGIAGMALTGPRRHRAEMCANALVGVVRHIDRKIAVKEANNRMSDQLPPELLPLTASVAKFLESTCRQLHSTVLQLTDDPEFARLERESDNYFGYCLFFLGFHTNRAKLRQEGWMYLSRSASSSAPLGAGNGVLENVRDAIRFAMWFDQRRAKQMLADVRDVTGNFIRT